MIVPIILNIILVCFAVYAIIYVIANRRSKCILNILALLAMIFLLLNHTIILVNIKQLYNLVWNDYLQKYYKCFYIDKILFSYIQFGIECYVIYKFINLLKLIKEKKSN